MKYSYLFLLLLFFSCSDDKDRPIQGMELDKDELNLRINEEAQLNVINFRPEMPEEYEAQWVSSDTNIVKVKNGIVRGVAHGWTYVHAVVDSVRSPSCRVNVMGVYDEDNDVYISGSVRDTAVYWKNGISVALTDGKFPADGRAIAIDGEDIYVAGYEETFTGRPNAKYWKNGEEILLSEESSYAVDITVSAGDVYVVGNVLNDEGSAYIITLWVNGEAQDISYSTEFADATSVYVDNGDVYVTGYSTTQSVDVFYTTPYYWKNGERVGLEFFSTAYAKDLAIHDSQVYVSGNNWTDDGSEAKYWLAEDEYVILPSNGEDAFGQSITFDNEDICVSGYVLDKTLFYPVPTYWKNGIQRKFTQDELIGNLCDITSRNGDIYLLANVIHEGEFHTTKYWKNEEEIIFLDWYDNSFARDIQVVSK